MTFSTPFVLQITKSDESVVTEVDEKVEQMNELHNMNKILRRKLREKEEQVNSILAQNAKDLQKAETSCSQLHQLNKQLENNLVMSETRLSELQTDYNGLAASAASAESQLHQLNKQLECNLSMSEIRISELQKDYDGLVASAASAESQLKDAQKDVGNHIFFVFCSWNFPKFEVCQVFNHFMKLKLGSYIIKPGL